MLRGALAATVLLLANLAAAQTPAQEHNPVEALRIQNIAEEAYIYGLPIVMNYGVMYSYAVDKDSPQYKAPFNHLHNIARVFTPEDKAVVTANSDTPYSFAWLDLRAEPMVLSVPPVEKGRYYSQMLCDGNTYNYGVIGSIATAGVPGDYLVVGPDWKGEMPKGIKKMFRSTTQFSMVGYRTQLFSPQDIENVKAIQAGYKVQPLSTWLKEPAPPAAQAVTFPAADKDSIKKNFFAYLDFALRFAPAAPEEKAIREKLASIGIGNGEMDHFKAVAAVYGEELAAGAAAGDKLITQSISQHGQSVNGWTLMTEGGGNRQRYNGDWQARAAVAKAGIYALDASEARYALTRTLPNGETLDASKHNYTFTFAAGELPPADAFWSVTMYDGATQLLVANPIQRYLINSPMLPNMQKNADGSLTIHIQKDSPGKDKESNWLPAPDGPVYLALRIYGPQEQMNKGQWQVPPLVLAD
ncbi:DUF1254 domain-containing protein [Pseudomonas arsenicoxydans]|uniref:DUF1254 domain-containing protein n=2 Tax=Pseudomonas arsenicoxydans TaxID=702115 RepID=A0A502H356_9PSED|nr:DUF1254 domain-containing protein [Pseudomonas arsenicoxydans]